jgi:F420-non-reducing hydrogenase large subunit
MKEIIIDPITRLEGHGNVSIFLNDKGEVENAYLKIPELRGFEKFCIGRRAELMPQFTSRICGVCPVAHHFAATKALDVAFNVEPTSAAKKLRELMYMATSSTTTHCTSTTSAAQTSSSASMLHQKNATS